MANNIDMAIQKPLKETIKTKIIGHKDEYYNYLINHYSEIILNLRKYRGAPASLDTVTLEYLLRSGYTAIIGENRVGIIQVLGYATNQNKQFYPFNLSNISNRIAPKQITWLVDKSLIPKEPSPIEFYDNGVTGNYVALTNKPFNFVNDYQTIEMYSRRIAEIQASRYSLIMQSKISTVLQFQNGDETANQLISDLYNGAGYIVVDKYVNPDRDIMHIGGGEIVSALETLKTSYKEEVDELNNQLGINSVGVQKQSGVSDDEARSNNEYVETATSIYTVGINKQLALLNRRYGLNIYAYLNQLGDTSQSELNEDYEKHLGSPIINSGWENTQK